MELNQLLRQQRPTLALTNPSLVVERSSEEWARGVGGGEKFWTSVVFKTSGGKNLNRCFKYGVHPLDIGTDDDHGTGRDSLASTTRNPCPFSRNESSDRTGGTSLEKDTKQSLQGD